MSAPLKVMLVGEGANELGDWIKVGPYRVARGVRDKALPSKPGVLETLLRKVAPDGWEIVDALPWSSLVKLTQRQPGGGDAKNLKAVLLHARERRHDVVVFSRDRDGAKNRTREAAIEAVIEEAPDTYPALRIVGAVAVETLEAWVLASAGDRHSETYADPAQELSVRFNVPAKNTEAMVDVVHRADLSVARANSRSLDVWLRRAEGVFAAPSAPPLRSG